MTTIHYFAAVVLLSVGKEQGYRKDIEAGTLSNNLGILQGRFYDVSIATDTNGYDFTTRQSHEYETCASNSRPQSPHVSSRFSRYHTSPQLNWKPRHSTIQHRSFRHDYCRRKLCTKFGCVQHLVFAISATNATTTNAGNDLPELSA